MRDFASHLKEYVLGAISDDYESLETVLVEIAYWAAQSGATVNAQEVVEALGGLILGGYAQAFSFEYPYKEAVPTEYSADRVKELWFYVTPKGKQMAISLQEEWR